MKQELSWEHGMSREDKITSGSTGGSRSESGCKISQALEQLWERGNSKGNVDLNFDV